jgi:hypothetical protein
MSRVNHIVADAVKLSALPRYERDIIEYPGYVRRAARLLDEAPQGVAPETFIRGRIESIVEECTPYFLEYHTRHLASAFGVI